MNTQLLQDIVLAAPILILFLMGCIPILIKVVRGNREPAHFVTLMYAFLGLLAAAGMTAVMTGTKRAAFSNAVVFDGMTAWASYLVYFVTAIALMLAYDHVATRGRQFSEFVFLVLSSVVGMIVLIMSNDLIVTFIGIETMSLSLYILVAMSKEEVLAKEAAFKYFVLGSFASAIFLYGVAFIYGTVGSTYFPAIAEAAGPLLSTNRLFLVGLGLVVLGFGFKVSLFPFHAWTPDVYQGAPTPITAFMATGVKAATFISFMRVLNSEAYVDSAKLLTIFQWLAVLTMFVGNTAALLQNNFKRMLAYSSVAHSGYLMVGLIAATFGTNYNAGATSVLFYLFSYSLMTLGAFALVALFERNENTALAVDDIKGFANKSPISALCLAVLMLSLAGVPPTLGFFGKFYLFSAAIEQDMYWLVFWGVINSVISVYYYLRPIVVMYMKDDQPAEFMSQHLMTRMMLWACAVLIVVMGLFSSPVLKAVQRAVF